MREVFSYFKKVVSSFFCFKGESLKMQHCLEVELNLELKMWPGCKVAFPNSSKICVEWYLIHSIIYCFIDSCLRLL